MNHVCRLLLAVLYRAVVLHISLALRNSLYGMLVIVVGGWLVYGVMYRCWFTGLVYMVVFRVGVLSVLLFVMLRVMSM